MPLSDAAIRAIKPTGKTRKIADERGLYLEVSPTGGTWWRLKYRFAGKEKRLSFGVYPDVGLRDARERRDAARGLLAKGIDPSEHRKAEKRALAVSHVSTFEAVAREWYGKHSPAWKESHRVRLLSMFDRCIFPSLGRRPIAEIQATEILPVIQKIERTAVDTAHRALADCGRVFRFAIASGRAMNDPTLALKGSLAPRRAQHFAATTEPRRLGAILRAMDAYEGTPVVCTALRLAPLLFVRPGELRRMCWAEVNLKSAEWRYKVSKTEGSGVAEHIVPLSTQAVTLLRELKALTGDGTLAFPGARGASRPMSDNAVLVALRSMEISANEMTGHGFRAVARTILDEVLHFRPDSLSTSWGTACAIPSGVPTTARSFSMSERR